MKGPQLVTPPMIKKWEKQKAKKCKMNSAKKKKKKKKKARLEKIENMHSQIYWKGRGKPSIWLAWCFLLNFLSTLGRKHFDGFEEKTFGPHQTTIKSVFSPIFSLFFPSFLKFTQPNISLSEKIKIKFLLEKV